MAPRLDGNRYPRIDVEESSWLAQSTLPGDVGIAPADTLARKSLDGGRRSTLRGVPQLPLNGRNLLNPGQPIPGNAPIVTRMPYPEWGPAGIQFLKAALETTTR
jgi:hypothetical protein